MSAENAVWIVLEFEQFKGYEAQGRPDRLLSTTLFAKREDAERLAKSLREQPEREVWCRQQFVNP